MCVDPSAMSQWPTEEQAFILQSFADTAQEGLCIATFDSNLVYANPKLASMTGVPVPQLLGTPIDAYFALEDRAHIESVVKERVRAGGVWSGELIMETMLAVRYIHSKLRDLLTRIQTTMLT